MAKLHEGSRFPHDVAEPFFLSIFARVFVGCVVLCCVGKTVFAGVPPA